MKGVLTVREAASAVVFAIAVAWCAFPFDAVAYGPLRIDVGSCADPLSVVCEKVRAARERGLTSNGVEVVFAPGDYWIGEGGALGPKDGGFSREKPVIWRAEKPGATRIMGGRRIPVSRFRMLTDETRLVRLPAVARGKVLVADIGDFPAEAFASARPIPPPVVFVSHGFGRPARWPNRGFVTFSRRVERGNERTPGAFVFENPRVRRWNFEEGVWLNGYWTHDWLNINVRAASWGPENGTNGVMRLASGVKSGIMGGTWGRKERRFYAFGLFDELDDPGEWWVDAKARRLYLMPPAGGLRDGDEVVIAWRKRPLVSAVGVKHLKITGLDFEYNCGNLLSFRDCEDVNIEDCRLSNATETAILMHGMGNRIAGCEIRGCGRSGIRLSGGDLKTLTCSGSVVERCRISDFGVLYRTYAPGIDAIGVGLTFRGNEIFNAPHAAVLYTGNEMLFEDNDVHHVLLETADAGAFYTGRRLTTCGNVLRWNFVHELGSGSDNADTMGFYFDDCDCGDAVYGNVFWKCARGIMIGGGREHPVVGNVFAACRYGLSIDARGLTLKDKWEKWGLVKEAESLGYREEPWRSKYPRLANILNDSPREPLYNSVISNVFVDCQEKLLFLDGKPEVMDPLVPKIPVCGNVVLTSAKGTKSPTPDPRVAAGFAVMDDPAEDWFRAPSSGDFSPGRAPKRLLDIGPRWRRRSQRGGGRMSDEVQKP